MQKRLSYCSETVFCEGEKKKNVCIPAEVSLEKTAYNWLGCGKFLVYLHITLSFVAALVASELDSKFDDYFCFIQTFCLLQSDVEERIKIQAPQDYLDGNRSSINVIFCGIKLTV